MVAIRCLIPEPTMPVGDLADWYQVARPAGHPTSVPRRPWIGVCMVTGLDGAIAVDGRSFGLSSPNDQQVLRALEDSADMILVGAGTVRDEQYGLPRRSDQRIAVVSQRCALDFDTELFRSGTAFIICPIDAPEVPVDTLRAGTGTVDLTAALARLGEMAPEPDFVLAEGGSVLNGALAAADLIDELNLTVSPQLTGGDAARLTAQAPQLVSNTYDLAHLLVDDESFLFSRWVRRRTS